MHLLVNFVFLEMETIGEICDTLSEIYPNGIHLYEFQDKFVSLSGEPLVCSNLEEFFLKNNLFHIVVQDSLKVLLPRKVVSI